MKAEIAMACSEDVLIWIIYSYLNSCLIFLVDEFLSDEQVNGLHQPYTAVGKGTACPRWTLDANLTSHYSAA